MVVCTPLGLDFLETHREPRMKLLRARREDLERAVRDALYAERLAARGSSPFELFLELNEIARSVENSSKAHRSA